MSATSSTSTPAGTPEYRLVYFNGRGLAEGVRLLFTIGKVPFVDERYSFVRNADGSVIRPEWEANKSNRDLFPFAKIPVLVLADGTSIAQSKAIERFVAKKVGLMGANDVEYALIDAIIEQMNDIRKAYNDARWKQDEGIALRNFVTKDLLPFLELFELWLERRKSQSTPYFVGESVTYADISLYYLIWLLENGSDDEKRGVAEALKKTPKIVALKEAVAAIPQLQEYVAKRPVTQF